MPLPPVLLKLLTLRKLLLGWLPPPPPLAPWSARRGGAGSEKLPLPLRRLKLAMTEARRLAPPFVLARAFSSLYLSP